MKEEHCCYCSSTAISDCNKTFPNWELMITRVEQIDQFNCDAVLKNVTEDDVGFYQCRVYDVYNYPCQRRFEGIYNYNISTANNDHSSSKGHFSVPDIALFIVSATLVAILAIIAFGIIACRKWRKSSSHSTHSK